MVESLVLIVSFDPPRIFQLTSMNPTESFSPLATLCRISNNLNRGVGSSALSGSVKELTYCCNFICSNVELALDGLEQC